MYFAIQLLTHIISTAMKKILSFFFVLGAFMLASCSTENEKSLSSGEGDVTYTVALSGQTATRAFADGLSAREVKCYVYDTNNGTSAEPVLVKDVVMPEGSLSGTLTLRLVSGREYDIIFLATSGADSHITYETASRTFSVDYTGVACSDEKLDAFYAVDLGYKVSGAASRTVELHRPFAQLNIGTDDISDYQAAISPVGGEEVAISGASLKVDGVYSEFDLMAGDIPADAVAAAVEFSTAALPTDIFPQTGYEYLAMNYLLVPATEQQLVNIELTVSNSDGTSDMCSFDNVPVRGNYRTNVFGSLLTSAATMNVEIMKDFDQPDYKVIVNTPAEFIAGIENGDNIMVPSGAVIELPAGTSLNLVDGQEIVNEGVIKVANSYALNVEGPVTATITGGEFINTAAEGSNEGRNVIGVTDGATLNLSNATLTTNGYHNGGSAIYVANIKELNLENVTVNSGFYAVGADAACGKITARNCTFNSNSSSKYGSWAYCVSVGGAGCEAVLESCVVNGIQGAVSARDNARLTIKSGTYSTHESEAGKGDAFYAVYSCEGAVVTIEGGEFYSLRNAIYGGDNDVAGREFGNFVLKGGKYSSQGYLQNTQGIVEPAEGYVWTPIADDELYKWMVTAE